MSQARDGRQGPPRRKAVVPLGGSGAAAQGQSFFKGKR
ncbi:hypothetical protein APV28_1107 [Comamonas testosteroni]|nr:hypothetical protein APV28_1107 [Comamonas testosteroni]